MLILRLKDYALRTVTAAVVSLGIFLILPGIQLLLKEDRQRERGFFVDKKIIMEVKKQKPKPKKVPKRQLRKVRTQSRAIRAQAQKFSFAPDLGVEGDGTVGVDRDNMESRIFDEGDTDEPPVPVSDPRPVYPPKARQMGIEGILEITLIVDHTGRVASVSINRAPHPMFREPVLKTVRGWRFKPGKLKGVPVNVKVRRKIRFSLGRQAGE